MQAETRAGIPGILAGEVTGAFLAHEPMVTSAGPAGQGGGMRFAVCLAPPVLGGSAHWR
jgi:hypothetical protein